MKLINNLAEGDKHDVAFSRDAERESPNYPIPGNGFLEGFAAAEEAAADSAISFRTRFRQIRILVRCFPRDADDNDDTPDNGDDDDEPLP